ncbi:folate family ECF transporter S component [Lactococcus garvieae]|jgi:ECF transporter S component (folate family)|uniref:Substrate-specific component FolT of folate ECF transporter n=1 Tax=Lactococcus garvieae DCC43 TaxID=1231377 RepID=K2PL89_9LACT|nr:folate family ECF transporter S component [Lactococcus garvieae]EKF52075.1 Substrate-specific component FolT of folate ECF transporter [Lactococcus garvieae DCC43]QPS70647.1 folate family ECF transporter S component [Lactococcus garvieae]
MKRFTVKLSLIQLVFLAILLALSIILRSFTFGSSFWKLSPGFVADGLIGFFVGPLWAGLALGLGDIFGVLFRGSISSPGMTITAVGVGIIYGYAFYNKKINITRSKDWLYILAIVSLIMFFQTLLLNTFWLSLMYQTPFKVLLATRIPLLIQIPIRTVILMLVFDNIQRIPQIMRSLKK